VSESEFITFVLKFLWLPLIGAASWITKSYFDKLDRILTEAERSEKALREKISSLEMELNKNYYDKIEIKQHIIEPFQLSLAETKGELKAFSAILTSIHKDLGIIKFRLGEGSGIKNEQ
jgi:hypothetical protein